MPNEVFPIPRLIPNKLRKDELMIRVDRIREVGCRALSSLLSRRQSTFLTALGVAIGMASVLVLMMLGEGLTQSIIRHFKSLGSNSVIVSSYSPPARALRRETPRLSFHDFEKIQQLVSRHAKLVPSIYRLGMQTSPVSYSGKSMQSLVIRTTEDFREINGRTLEEGRFLVRPDIMENRKVAVVGKKLADDLSGTASLLGRHILVDHEWYRVVGVMEKKGDLFGMSQDDFVIVPMGPPQYLQGQQDIDVKIQMQLKDMNELDMLAAKIKRTLRTSHKLGEGDDDDFRIQTTEQLLSSIRQLSSLVSGAFLLVVCISLLVAGIGIMNMMLTSVSQRKTEIGLYLALGATPRLILVQFLMESVLVCLLGSLLGISGAFSLSLVISFLFPAFQGLGLSFSALVFSTAFSIFIGVFFGLFPAWRASQLSPVEALRDA